MCARLASATSLGSVLGSEAGKYSNLMIEDLVLDSRDVQPGAAFVAVPGASAHGLQFVPEAIAQGAVVVFYDRPAEAVDALGFAVPMLEVPNLHQRFGELANKLYGTITSRTALAGITGTNGKTTVAWLVAQAANFGGAACAYLGTLGYGVPPALITHGLTTPDCFTLHRELAALATEHAALEVSSHALAQNRIAGLTIATTAFTNLGRDHFDAHGDLEQYGRAKARLFTREGVRKAVLNVGDPFAQQLLAQLPAGVEPIRVLVHGGSSLPDADLVAHINDRGLAGLELSVSGRFGTARFASRLIGEFNAENLLVALGILLAWDIPLAAACEALGQAVAPPGRFEVIRMRQSDPTVIVDYAHTPEGLDRVLRVLQGLSAGDIWCVFGCGGERDRGKRPLMGKAAALRAQHLVLTDDNPRSEDPAAIIEDIRAGIVAVPQERRASLTIEHDRRLAIENAIRAAGSDDVVLIAGKGHETAQYMAGGARPFSDRESVAATLGARPC